MDANGLTFWMLAEGQDWEHPDDPATLHYDQQRRVLRLASRSSPRVTPDADAEEARGEALARLALVPRAADGFGTVAYWDAGAGLVMATGAAAGAVPILAPPAGSAPSDLLCGHDGVLYCALGGGVLLQDRRGRWDAVSVRHPSILPWRMSADPAGGVWVLDRASGRLGRVSGLPPVDRPAPEAEAESFHPCPSNPHPPRLDVAAEPAWGAGEVAVGIACSLEGRPVVLTWDASGVARLYAFVGHGRYAPPCTLLGASFPYSVTWTRAARIAVATVGLPTEALVYELTDGVSSVEPVGEYHPLFKHDGGPFLHTLAYPARYPTLTEPGSSPLHPLSMPSYAPAGTAHNRDPHLTAPSDAATTWHRIYLEASIPPNCGVKVFLAATDTAPSPEQRLEWHEHHFGSTTADPGPARVPNGAWVPYRSEVPFHPGLLDCPTEPGTAGLFTALVQRSNRPVSALRGRFLQVKVQLVGDGRATPEVAAVRVYGSRFSYAEHYLPSVYQEDRFGPDADVVPARSTPADFLERFLDNFEGVLTPLEDRVGAAYLLTDPRTTYDESLEWLGTWLGVTFDPSYPTERRRRLLEATPELYRRRGCLQGLRLALDVAFDGACSRGEIIVLEDFRLRRTFATILGADLADEDDPLLGGIMASGNSFVGDTLFLGDEGRREFLSVFTEAAALTEADRQAIEEFLERLAFQVTVLVHGDLHLENLDLVRRIVQLETPAHVLVRVSLASAALLVGIASLVGIDTFLTEELSPQPVTAGRSQVGVRDRIMRPATLDSRLAGGLLPPTVVEPIRPTADAGEDVIVPMGSAVTLDASRSQPGPGRRITRYVWTLLTP